MELRRRPRGRSGARIRPAAATAAFALALTLAGMGCGSRREAALRLVDGSLPPPRPGALDGVGEGAVLSRVRVLRASALDDRGEACVRAFRPEFRIPPTTIVVERTGTVSESLTLRDARHHLVLGCDRTVRPAESGGPWCARSVGRLFSGRLRDPRVDILCRDARGDAVGFGWVEPAPGARWVASRIGHAMEVEEVAAGLPVRIATAEVDAATSSATFDVAEYDPQGKEVSRHRLTAGVAG